MLNVMLMTNRRVMCVAALLLVAAPVAAEDVALELVDGLKVVGEQVPEGLRPAHDKKDKAEDDKHGAITRDADGYAINWINLTNSADIDVSNGSTTASINLHGQLQIPPDRNPAAYIIEINDVFDFRGKSLMNRKLSRWSGTSQQWPVQRISQHNRNQSQWSLSSNLSGLVGWSTSIDRVTGTVYLLEVESTKQIDLPLSPGDKFTDLAGDVAIKVTKVERQSNSLTVRYAIKSPNPQALNDLASPPFFWRQALLDEAGEEIPAGPSYSNRSSTSEGYLRFYMQNAQAAPKSVRFSLATDANERKLKFDLRDLRMNPEPKQPAEVKPNKPDAAVDEGDPAKPADKPNGDAKPGPVDPKPKPDKPVRKGIGGAVFE